MTATDVADLLASIDDVLETASAPAPVPAPAAPVDSVEPVVAAEPALPAEPVEVPAEAAVEAPEAAAEAPVGESRVSASPRLPYWWEQDRQPKPEPEPRPRVGRAAPADTADTARSCEHGRLLPLRAERGDEVVGRLCLDCDERFPATDDAEPEPEPECEHKERLEARSEGGRLIGYVCAAEGCGARLTVDEVHGRIGKWLRPAARYYPQVRNPFSPADGEDAPKRALSAGTLRLIANAAAAGAGYAMGLVPLLGSWIEECGEVTSIGGALVLGGSICLLVGHFWDRRTRHWYPGLAWVARIPLASAITALALYAPASQV